MSMSEFERQFEESEYDREHDHAADYSDYADLSTNNREFPDDFSAEDIDFARELEALFVPEREEMPPFFVQTLMASEDPRFRPVEHGFEKKTSVRVFRKLKLRRRLYKSARFSLGALLPPLPVSRPFAAVGAAFAFFMFLTMLITGPAFASGLNILWAGAHSGVLQVDAYPHIAHPENNTVQNSASSNSQSMNLVDALQYLKFPMFLPQYVPEHYTPSDIYLYPADQRWADGPVAILNYTYALPGVSPKQLAICEFKPQGNVFQVVNNGAAQQVKIGPAGSSTAIYVEGQWTHDNNATPSWVYSDRSQMIYADPTTGVVFWIVGDQHSGITTDELQKILSSLHPFNRLAGSHLAARFNQVTPGGSGVDWIFANDVIYLDNPDNSSGPSFILVGDDPNAASSGGHPLKKPSASS